MTALLILAFALATDAFAAAIGQGAGARPKPGWPTALRVGAVFGVAQGVMPLFGWALSLALASLMRELDHWVVLLLLSGIGVHMIVEGVRHTNDPERAPAPVARGAALATLALATSVDAAAAGVTLDLLGPSIAASCAVIAAVTFCLATAGVLLGRYAAGVLGRQAEIVGGLVLIALGLKIFVEHQFFGG